MAAQFDAYQDSYREAVQSSIDFSGLPHSFFMAAKAELLGETVRAHFGATAKPKALDVGCGVGELHPYVRGLFGHLSGVDVSPACIERARAMNAGVEYQCHDGSTLPYGAGEFDALTAVCVMHHVLPADWRAFMMEARRVVRPGGLVCVIEHNPFNPLTRLAVSRCEFDRDAVLLRAAVTARLMLEAGLGNVRSRYFLMLPFAGALARRTERLFARLPLGAQYMTRGQV